MSEGLLRTPEAPVLVGRTGELHALLDAMAHPPAVAFVEGEAGIGKTRLIYEALRKHPVEGRRVLVGHCHPLREPFPYGPVFDLLRRLAPDPPVDLNLVCGALRAYLPELADVLPEAPEPLPDPAASRHRLYRAVRALLEALGDAVVVVEDLHWADDGTRDLLRFLVDDPPENVSIVLSYRREDLAGGGLPLGRAYRQRPNTTAVLLALEPLDVHAVRSMCAAITESSDVPGTFAAEVHQRTAGIPFVVEEVVRALPDDSYDGSAGSETLESMAVPTLLQEAVADRMSALSDASADIVRAASVVRVPAGERLLDAVARDTTDQGEPVAVPARTAALIREALEAGVLYEWGDDRYGFRHGLAQQAVYANIAGPDRRRLHRRVMRVLAYDDPQPFVHLAYHARLGGEDDLWQEYTEAAAKSAREMGDLALAVQVQEDLLADGRPSGQERARIALELSRDAVFGINHRRIAELLRTTLTDNRIPDGVSGEIRLNLGLLLLNQAGRYADGRVDTELAVDELRDRPALAARGMAALAMPIWGDDPHDVHENWIQLAEKLVEDASDPTVKMAVRGNRLSLLMCGGDPSVWDEAERLIADAWRSADRQQVARVCCNFADAATWIGHYPAAHEYREEGRRLAADCGATYLEGVVEGTSLRLEWYAGRWEGLAERARQAVHISGGVSGIAADAQLVLGLLASATGEWDEAVERLDAAGLADPANAQAPILATASGAMTRIHLARGEVASAVTAAQRGIARIRRKEIWTWAADLAPMAVQALTRGGRLDEAEDVTAELSDGIEGLVAPRAAAALPVCRGIVAAGQRRFDDAASAFDTAHERYAALGQPYSAARTLEASCRCRISPGDDSAARTLLRLVGEFEALGAIHDAARCRRELRANSMPLPSRRGRRGYGEELSPRESEVARLVSCGHTNREIAEVLFLSPRTVEQHVAKVLRKLNVSSRSDVTYP